MARSSYRIVHSTTYTYQVPVRVCHNIVMLHPRHDGATHPQNYRVLVKPHPEFVARREDYFGNQVQTFSLNESHRQLLVSASGKVDVVYPELPVPEQTQSWQVVRDQVLVQYDPNWFEVCQYRFDSPRVTVEPQFLDYARVSFRSNRPILEAALELTHRIHQDFEYDPRATEVHTPTTKAFEIRRGVCQDFAHVQIACLRSLGLSARYVSGYLRTEPVVGHRRLIGSDQSHAWVALYCGPEVGWIEFDPTNDKTCDSDHVPIAWGRDYHDVIPVRGVFLGGGDHDISVSVHVTAI